MKQKSKTLRRAANMLAASVLAMSFAGTAHAVCSTYGADFTFTIPDVRLVGNAADIGEAISPWHNSNRVGIMLCGDSGLWAQTNTFTGLPREIGTHTIGSSIYGVFETSVPGVGFIMAAEVDDVGSASFVPLRGAVESRNYAPRTMETTNANIAIRFIKIGETIPGNYTIGGFQALTLKHYQPATTKRFEQQHSLDPVGIEVVHVNLCHVQSKSVYMGLANLDQFKNPGSAAPSRPYSVEINCEVNAGRVNYFLEPSSVDPYDRRNGILEVEGGAKGIGLQLLDATGAPVSIGAVYPFGSSSADGLRSESFRARYIRTAKSFTDIETGPANAQIRYRIDYP